MSLKKLRLFITLVALLAFVGQAMATVIVSCSMMDADSPDKGQMTGVVHSAHTMHALADKSSQSKATSVDCCGDALCSMSHCVGSAIFIITTSPQVYLNAASVLNTGYSFSYLAPDTPSLFRPPIIH